MEMLPGARKLKDMVSETVATLGASEGGAHAVGVGGIGPKGRSFRDHIL